MITTLRMVLTCRWSARRLQRCLDDDQAAPPRFRELRRLEAHLADCEKCRSAAGEYRMIGSALAQWAARTLPDQHAVERMHCVVDRLVEGELR